MRQIKVIIADDHRIMLDGLKMLLQQQKNIEVIGEAENGRSAVELALKLKPEVVIMDIDMPDMNGIVATRNILDREPDIRVLTLSMHSDKRFVSKALREGVSGYMLKECASAELVEAINTVVSGKTYLSPQIADVVISDYRKQLVDKEYSADSVLTKKEREILQLFAEGKTTKEIAYMLNVSVKTVETHRSRIMEKLDIHSIAELTKFAIREGLTSL